MIMLQNLLIFHIHHWVVVGGVANVLASVWIVFDPSTKDCKVGVAAAAAARVTTIGVIVKSTFFKNPIVSKYTWLRATHKTCVTCRSIDASGAPDASIGVILSVTYVAKSVVIKVVKAVWLIVDPTSVIKKFCSSKGKPCNSL